MKELTFGSNQYTNFKDAVVYTFLQRKYQFKQSFSPAAIRQHIKLMIRLYRMDLSWKQLKDIYEYLIALDDADVTIDTAYVPDFDMTIISIDTYHKADGDIFTTAICGFHFGEPDNRSSEFAFDNTAVFDSNCDMEDK